MANKLLLFYSSTTDTDLREYAQQTIGPFWGIGANQQKAIDTLGDMAQEIGKYQSLDELVVFAHGFAGGIMLDDDNGDYKGYKLEEQAVADAFAKTKTQIKHIRFEGCWVGEDPQNMAVFGRLFKASDVSGFTWVHYSNSIIPTIPKGITARDLQDFFETKGLARWLAPGTPSVARLASMAANSVAKPKLMLEWFEAEDDDKAPYNDSAGNLAADSGKRSNMQQLGKHKYKVRKEATSRTVQAKDARPSDDPILPFEYVTVKLP